MKRHKKEFRGGITPPLFFEKLKIFFDTIKTGFTPAVKIDHFYQKSMLHFVLHRVVFNRFFIPIIGILSFLF